MKPLFATLFFTLLFSTASAQWSTYSEKAAGDTTVNRVGIEAFFPVEMNLKYDYTLSEEGNTNAPKEFTMQFIGANTTGGGGFIQAKMKCEGMLFPQGTLNTIDTIGIEITPEILHRISAISPYDEVILHVPADTVITWQHQAGYQKVLYKYSYMQHVLPSISVGGRNYENCIMVTVQLSIDATRADGNKSEQDYYFVFAKNTGLIKFKTWSGAVYELTKVEKP